MSQLKFIAKMKNGENNEEIGNMKEQLKTVMKELEQNTTAVSEKKWKKHYYSIQEKETL